MDKHNHSAAAGTSQTHVVDGATTTKSATTANNTIAAQENGQDIASNANALSAADANAVGAVLAAKPNGSPPPSNKIKSQQQQHHQFRAPQQFVKQKRCASSLPKKNKPWNKRQNKLGKPMNNAALAAGLTIGAVAAGGAQLNASNTSKADLENIQNLRNQPGGYHFYHRGGASGSGNASNSGLPPALSLGLDKVGGYSHGHLKQQLYKKMLTHSRAHHHHHHHVLCAGAAHNSLGGSVAGAGVGGANLNCCQINGCSHHNGKDAVNVGGTVSGGVGAGNTSVSSAGSVPFYCCVRSKFFLPDKRPRKEVIVPPTKFLLGGNISDPLNLNSLQNETSNASTNTTPATTPRQSPITTPPKVEVIIPPNINDPLHLLDPVDSMEYEKQLTSPMKRGGCLATKLALGLRCLNKPHHKSHHRHRKGRKPKRRRHDSYTSNATSNNTSSVSTADLDDACSLANSTTSTADTSTMLSLSNQMDNSNSSGFNNTTTHAIGESGDEQSNECVPLAGSPNAIERLERNNSPIQAAAKAEILTAERGMTTEQLVQRNALDVAQQVVMGSAVAEGCVAVSVGCLPRERPSRDMRLELSTTTAVGTAGAAAVTATTAGSTCTSNNVIAGGGAGGPAAAAAAGARKRKISESNSSQKSKKFPRYDAMDKIVSPVVPQPGAWKRPPRLTATGARKPTTRRSRSVSENEALSPVDETVKAALQYHEDTTRDSTPDLSLKEAHSESGVGSPLSTISATTSLATGEQDTASDVNSLPGQMAPPAAADTAVDALKLKLSQAAAAARLTKMPKFAAEGAKYRYGNYDRYAGYHSLNEFMDVRLQVFQRHLELFQNKDVLDIGCNSGHMTITVGRHFAPKSILGIDIDKDLIARARRNLAMHVRIPLEQRAAKETPIVKKEMEPPQNESVEPVKPGKRRRKRTKRKPALSHYHMQLQLQHQQQLLHHHHHHYHHYYQHLKQQQQLQALHVSASELFPVSFPLNYGGIPSLPVSGTALATNSTPTAAGSSAVTSPSKPLNDFPRNVYFRQTNYILKDEALLANDTQQYDVIMCLSVTKWIHLNFGDAGLKMAFKRMFNQLRPGGKLILEAQNWASYKKKKNLTEEIYNNYRQIELFPNKFHEYLLSSEVGFSHSYTLGVPRHLNKGFSRPIQLYAKGDYTPNHVRWSDAYYPQTPFEEYRGIYATMPPRPPGLIYPMSSTRSQTYDTPQYTGSASGSYSCRQTPMHQPTSQYYNPLETDSYQPSYDMEYLNHMYVFASPLYQTVWSPPASMRRNSSTHTPVFGSVRDPEYDGDGSAGVSGGGSYHRHVYPPNDDTMSPNANAGNAFNSIRDPDTDDSNQLPTTAKPHVYATNCGESSSSPQVNHHDGEHIEGLILDDEQLPSAGPSAAGTADINEA